MPSTLAPIPIGVAITDRDGAITIFFRLLWDTVRAGFQLTPTRAELAKTGQTAGLATTTIYTTLTGGLYRVSYYIRKTVADGVSSSLTVTLGWTENGVPQTKTFAALTTDTTTAEQDNSLFVLATGATDLTIAIAYASNTPNRMTYLAYAVAEQMA